MIKDYLQIVKIAQTDFERAKKITKQVAILHKRSPYGIIDPTPYSVQSSGGATSGFHAAISRAYSELPEVTRRHLHDSGVRVTVGGITDDVNPRGKNHFSEPKVDDNRVHQNQIAGGYHPVKKEVMVTQFQYNRTRIPSAGETPNISGVINGDWVMSEPSTAQGIIRHEVGHAVDDTTGRPSQSPGFIAAHAADIAALGGADAARTRGLGYFVYEGAPHRGWEETFAEIWGAHHGGTSHGKEIHAQFPESAKWVQAFQKKFEEAHAKGNFNLQDFIDETHDPSKPLVLHDLPSDTHAEISPLLGNSHVETLDVHASKAMGVAGLAKGVVETAVAIRQGDYTAAAQIGTTTVLNAALQNRQVLEKIGEVAATGLKLLRVGGEEIPLAGAVVAGGFAVYETGAAGVDALRGKGTWAKVGTTAAANGAEIGGGLLGFGAGQAGRQAVVEVSKRTLGDKSAPTDASAVSLGKEIYQNRATITHALQAGWQAATGKGQSPILALTTGGIAAAPVLVVAWAYNNRDTIINTAKGWWNYATGAGRQHPSAHIVHASVPSAHNPTDFSRVKGNSRIALRTAPPDAHHNIPKPTPSAQKPLVRRAAMHQTENKRGVSSFVPV